MSEKKFLGNRSAIFCPPSPSPSSIVRTSRTILHCGPERKISRLFWIDRPSKAPASVGLSALVIDAQVIDSMALHVKGPKVPKNALLAEPETQTPDAIEACGVASCGVTSKPKRAYNKRPSSLQIESIPLKDRPILTFSEASVLYPASEQALRRLARAAEQYQKYPKAGLRSNGFEKCLIRHAGSRYVYLNAEQLAVWWTDSNHQ